MRDADGDGAADAIGDEDWGVAGQELGCVVEERLGGCVGGMGSAPDA